MKANVIGSVPAGEDPELFFGGLGFRRGEVQAWLFPA